MEILVEIKFNSSEQSSTFWAQLAEGLCNHQRGAWLEEQFNHFGEEASALLTDVMNECNRTNARGEPLILKPGHKMATVLKLV